MPERRAARRGGSGLVSACYLARAAAAVTVVEQSEVPWGGSRTEETIPGLRFDTHSAAHSDMIKHVLDPRRVLTSAGRVCATWGWTRSPWGSRRGEPPVRFFGSIDAILETCWRNPTPPKQACTGRGWS